MSTRWLATGFLLVGCGHAPAVRPGSVVVDSGEAGADSAPLEQVPGDTAPAWTPCTAAPPVVLNELMSANQHGLTDAQGSTSDWLELKLPDGAAPVDLTGWILSQTGTDAGWVMPAETLQPGTTLLVWASGNDTTTPELAANFGLSALGDDLFLRMPDGCVADHVVVPRLYEDVSYGRREDTAAWEYFVASTPGALNTTESRPGFADLPTFSPLGGFYDNPAVTATGPAGSVIRYTLDGSLPDESSPLFPSTPLALDAVTQPVVVRARAFVDGLWPSRMTTETYFGDPSLANLGVRIISLTANPSDLFDPVTGMYEPGPGASPEYPYFGANFWQPWERDVHVELYAPGGDRMLDEDAGIQIAGGYSRAFDQRNFEVLTGTGYGLDDMPAKVFDDETIDDFHRLYLRNGGDWCSTQLVDDAVQQMFRDDSMVQNPALDMQAYEPALVYINGEFWGLYELRERLDEYYDNEHHGVDTAKLDRVKLGWTHVAHWTLEEGSLEAFNELNTMAADDDLSDPAVYKDFTSRVDVDNFIAATVAEGWIGNTDWWVNSIRMWRVNANDYENNPVTDADGNGRFRWMSYDYGHGWPDWNYDHLATTVNGDWEGLPEHAALQNPDFRDRFINIHADFLNTSLSADVATARLDALAAETRPVMQMQRERWCGGASMDGWESDVAYAESFTANRPAAFESQLRSNLGITGKAGLTLKAEGQGTFHLAVVTVAPPWSGTYYLNVPVTVTALPAAGWTFAGWSGEGTVSDTDATTIVAPMAGNTTLTATFTQ